MQKHKREENKGQTPPNSQTTKTELKLHTKPDPVKKPSKQQLAFDELSNENKILRMRVKVKKRQTLTATPSFTQKLIIL